MKLSQDAEIAPEKLTRYLLVKRSVGDKSEFLKLAGYTYTGQLATVRAGYSSATSARGGRRGETNRLWRIFCDHGFLDRPQRIGVAGKDSVD